MAFFVPGLFKTGNDMNKQDLINTANKIKNINKTLWRYTLPLLVATLTLVFTPLLRRWINRNGNSYRSFLGCLCIFVYILWENAKKTMEVHIMRNNLAYCCSSNNNNVPRLDSWAKFSMAFNYEIRKTE